MKKIKLSNGVEMPQLGYGVYEKIRTIGVSNFFSDHHPESCSETYRIKSKIAPTWRLSMAYPHYW